MPGVSPVPRHLDRARVALALTAFAALGATAIGVGTGTAGAAEPLPREELTDLESKAQYAFFTDDLNALEGLARATRGLATSDVRLELYQYAHVQFRRLQVAAHVGRKRDAEDAGEACVDALDRALAQDARFAEGLALQADCYGYLATLGPVRAATAGPKADARAAAAARLNPNNPRVMLAEAFERYFRANGDGRAQAAALFLRAAGAFDAVESLPRPGEPTWGAAEAWLFVGRGYQEQGDLLAARNAYERALVVAPEFARARARLATLARR